MPTSIPETATQLPIGMPSTAMQRDIQGHVATIDEETTTTSAAGAELLFKLQSFSYHYSGSGDQTLQPFVIFYFISTLGIFFRKRGLNLATF